MQAYSNPKRASDPYSLPDVEVFYRTATANTIDGWVDADGDPLEAGWFWCSCFPGCLPDSEPMGPFATREEALADAQSDAYDEDDEDDDEQTA